MRGIETGKVRIRHEVFTEIARMAYEGGDYAKRLEELPFKIIPGEIGSYRDSLFLERAVVGERLRRVRTRERLHRGAVQAVEEERDVEAVLGVAEPSGRPGEPVGPGGRLAAVHGGPGHRDAEHHVRQDPPGEPRLAERDDVGVGLRPEAVEAPAQGGADAVHVVGADPDHAAPGPR